MKSFFSKILFFSGLLFVSPLFSQNQNSQWYFGSFAGLDFTTNPPGNLTNGAMYTAEGSSSVADATGNLLF